MDRVNAIMQHPLFVERMERIAELERGRIFCGHGWEHLLDVARITYILCMESDEGGCSKELIYAAALLHDIGRARQYEDGTPHEVESAELAQGILERCGFKEEESVLILDAIISHRTDDGGGKPGFARHLYRADKLSRRCSNCVAISRCYLKKKNIRLEY